jgi:hypothetical protein
MAALAQLLLARPHAADLRRPWETRPPAGRPLTPVQVRRGFANIRRLIGTPAHVAKPAKQARDARKGPPAARPPATQSRRKRHQGQTRHIKQKVKG